MKPEFLSQLPIEISPERILANANKVSTIGCQCKLGIHSVATRLVSENDKIERRLLIRHQDAVITLRYVDDVVLLCQPDVAPSESRRKRYKGLSMRMWLVY
jgi:hypothetical protein